MGRRWEESVKTLKTFVQHRLEHLKAHLRHHFLTVDARNGSEQNPLKTNAKGR